MRLPTLFTNTTLTQATLPHATSGGLGAQLGDAHAGRRLFEMARPAPLANPRVSSGLFGLWTRLAPTEEAKYRQLIQTEVSLKCPLLGTPFGDFGKVLISKIYDIWAKQGFPVENGLIPESLIDHALRTFGTDEVSKYKKAEFYKTLSAGIEQLLAQLQNPLSRKLYWTVKNPQEAITDRLVALYPSMANAAVQKNDELSGLAESWEKHASPVRYEIQGDQIITFPDWDTAIHKQIDDMIQRMEKWNNPSIQRLRPLYQSRRHHTRLGPNFLEALATHVDRQNKVLSGGESILGLPSAQDLMTKSKFIAPSPATEDLLKTRSLREFSDLIREHGFQSLADQIDGYLLSQDAFLNYPEDPTTCLKLLSLVFENEFQVYGSHFFGEDSQTRFWDLSQAVSQTVSEENLAQVIEGFSMKDGDDIAAAIREYFTTENPPPALMDRIPLLCGIRARTLHFKKEGIEALRAELDRQKTLAAAAITDKQAVEEKIRILEGQLHAAQSALTKTAELLEETKAKRAEDQTRFASEKENLATVKERSIAEQAALHRQAVDALKAEAEAQLSAERARLGAEHEAAIQGLAAEHQAALAANDMKDEERLNAKIREMSDAHRTMLDDLAKTHEDQITAMATAAESNVEALDRIVAQFRETQNIVDTGARGLSGLADVLRSFSLSETVLVSGILDSLAHLAVGDDTSVGVIHISGQVAAPAVALSGDVLEIDDIELQTEVPTSWSYSTEDMAIIFGREQIDHRSIVPNHVIFTYDMTKRQWSFRRNGDSEQVYWREVKLGKGLQPLTEKQDRILLGEVGIQVVITSDHSLQLTQMSDADTEAYRAAILTQKKSPPPPPGRKPSATPDEPTPLPEPMPGLGIDTGPVTRISSAKPGQEWLDVWRNILFEKVVAIAAAQKELARLAKSINEQSTEQKQKLESQNDAALARARRSLVEKTNILVEAFKAEFRNRASLSKYPDQTGDITPENTQAMSEINNLTLYKESFLDILLNILAEDGQNQTHHTFLEPLSTLLNQLPNLLPSGTTSARPRAKLPPPFGGGESTHPSSHQRSCSSPRISPFR